MDLSSLSKKSLSDEYTPGRSRERLWRTCLKLTGVLSREETPSGDRVFLVRLRTSGGGDRGLSRRNLRSLGPGGRKPQESTYGSKRLKGLLTE